MRIIIGIIGLIWKLHIAAVFFITAIIFYPLIVPFLFSDKTRNHSFNFFVAWSWAVRIFCFYFVSKKKVSPLPEGSYIIVANHMSYLDIFLMPSILPALYISPESFPIFEDETIAKTTFKNALSLSVNLLLDFNSSIMTKHF